MLMLSLLLSTTLVSGAGAGGSGAGDGIPAWARRYNVNCSHCHAPAIPELNATGIYFKWAGYRLPEDIGVQQTVSQVSNYIAARAQIDYVWEKTSGQPTSTSELADPTVTFIYAGPFGKNFGGWVELGLEGGEVGGGAAVTGVFGKERSYGGFRLGETPMYLESGVAGFDRPIGIEAPIPAASPVSFAIPFSFEGDQKAAEGFYVVGHNRAAVQVLGSYTYDGTALVESGSTKKDIGVTDQLLIDDKGSAIYAVGYYGNVTGLDNAFPDATSNFWRVGLSASKIIGSDTSNFTIKAGGVYGKDVALPVGGVYSVSSNTGYGYWFAGQYSFPHPNLTFFARYEFIDPDTQTDQDGTTRYVFGAVLPICLPQYIRLAAEYHLDTFQAPGASSDNAAVAEVQLVF